MGVRSKFDQFYSVSCKFINYVWGRWIQNQFLMNGILIHEIDNVLRDFDIKLKSGDVRGKGKRFPCST